MKSGERSNQITLEKELASNRGLIEALQTSINELKRLFAKQGKGTNKFETEPLTSKGQR